MKIFAICFLLFSIASATSLAQKPQPNRTPASTKRPAFSKLALNEQTEFNQANAETDAQKRIALLKTFLTSFPKTARKERALEIIVSARAQIADEKLRLGENSEGLALFKLAVSEAPAKMTEKFFNEVVLQFPTNLLYRGELAGAFEVANLIEERVVENSKQLLALASFHLGAENALSAIRIAEKVLQLDSSSIAAHQVLGLAYRINFDLEKSAAAYQRAIELDPKSAIAKRSLAEMKRALGESSEALAIYRELVAADANDGAAQTGLVLSLFDSGKITEAETELQKTLERNPANLFLLVGVSYWYAAKDLGDKSVEYGSRAVALEPRYTWASIALARGFLAQKKPLDAERVLLAARQYGNFPTLDYELASARFTSGYYEEAAAELRKTFIEKDGNIETRLGGRLQKSAATFLDLLALERRASIFQPAAAEDTQRADQLKSLLRLSQSLDSASVDQQKIASAVDEFVKVEDNSRAHRNLFAATRLLKKRILLDKVQELTQNSVGGLESALQVPSATSAVLADELYDSRARAFSRGQLIVAPEIPAATLSKILRGRIEEISGWAFYYQEKNADAITHLKRAVSILPEKSAWWRSSLWRLGAALETDAQLALALDAYIRSYTAGEPELAKRATIESLYTQIYGSLDGLEQRMSSQPATDFLIKRPTVSSETVAKNSEAPKFPDSVPVAPSATPTPEAIASPSPVQTPNPIAVETPTPAPTPTPTPIVVPTPTPMPTPTPTPVPIENISSEAIASVAAKEIPSPTPLFESVVIQVPAIEKPKSQTETKDDSPPEKNSPENEVVSEPEKDRKLAEVPTQNRVGRIGSGDRRPRVVVTDNIKIEPSCDLVVTREKVSVIRNGGIVGLSTALTGNGKISEVFAKSLNPEDVSIRLDLDSVIEANRGIFIITSISKKTGEFLITLESPCGKKDVLVNVR